MTIALDERCAQSVAAVVGAVVSRAGFDQEVESV